VCKSADLLLMVLDATKPWGHRDILTRELEAVGMRLNKCGALFPAGVWVWGFEPHGDGGRRRLPGAVAERGAGVAPGGVGDGPAPQGTPSRAIWPPSKARHSSLSRPCTPARPPNTKTQTPNRNSQSPSNPEPPNPQAPPPNIHFKKRKTGAPPVRPQTPHPRNSTNPNNVPPNRLEQEHDQAPAPSPDAARPQT
jgi:hypothetical protein